MAQVPSGVEAIQLKKGSVSSPTRPSTTNPPQLSTGVLPSAKPFQAPLKLDYTQAAGDLPSQDNKGIPPSVLRHVTPQPYNNNATSPVVRSVEPPGSAVQPKAAGATSIPNVPPLRPAIKFKETASSSIPSAPPPTIPAGSTKISIVPKDGNGLPPSLLSNVTPQPYKYSQTSPTFASVKAPVSADQAKETVASIPKAPPLPVLASNKISRAQITLAPRANQPIPTSRLTNITLQPYNSIDTSPTVASAKFPDFVAAEAKEGGASVDVQRPTLVSKPAFPTGPDQQNRAILAAPNYQSSVLTQSEVSSFAQSSVSSITSLVPDPKSKKGLELQKSKPETPLASAAASGLPDSNLRAASAPSSRPRVGFVQPSAADVLEIQAKLDRSTTDSNINGAASSAKSESNAVGVSPSPVKSGTETRKSKTAKTDSEPRRSAIAAVPAEPDTEVRNSGNISVSDKSLIVTNKSGRSLRRASSGTDTRKPGTKPSPVQSVTDLFNSKNDASNGVNASSKRSLRKAGPGAKKSDLVSNKSDVESVASATSQTSTRNFKKQVDPRTKIVSSSSRPRLIEPGYKRSIPLQSLSRGEVKPNQRKEVPLKSAEASRSRVSVGRRGSADRRGICARRDNVQRRDNSEKEASGGDSCKLQDKSECKIEKGSADCDDKTRKSELSNYAPDCWRDFDYKPACKTRNVGRCAVMPFVYPITAGSPDACLPVYEWQPSSANYYPVNQRRSCFPPQGSYRTGPMCDPYYSTGCSDAQVCSPCPPRQTCTRPCDPYPRQVCPRPCSPCARPVCSPCQRPNYPTSCSPCPRPICSQPCSPCQPRPICPQPCSPSPCQPRPICQRPCSPPACLPCDLPMCPRPCSPRQCDRPACAPRPLSPCLPPVFTAANSTPPNTYGYPCREGCDPECDLNRCKPLVKPASREIPDNFKCIPNLQQQFLINGCLRNAAAATATAANIYGGPTGCPTGPICDTPCNYANYANAVSCNGGVLRHVSPGEIGRNRCATLRPTPELQRILDYRRQMEDEWEAMEEEACCENPDCGIGCSCVRR